VIVTPPPEPDFSHKRNVPWKAILWIAVLLSCFGCCLAIVLPEFACARYAAEQSVCLQNIKQAAMGTILYAADHDDRLPPASRWMDSLASGAVKDEVFACPDVRKENPSAYGYAMKDALSSKPTTGFKEPAKTILYFDSVLLGRNAHSAFGDMPDPPRYSGNCVGYLDGHAKRLQRWR
jgi:hypothetical protein